jgi:hypothetical protein
MAAEHNAAVMRRHLTEVVEAGSGLPPPSQ